MKKFTFILQAALIFFVAFAVLGCSDDNDDMGGIEKTVISEGALPKASMVTINAYFKEAQVKQAMQFSKPNIYSSLYSVSLSNKFEIDFNKDGVWTEVESEDNQPIPAAFMIAEVPLIHAYLMANFDGLYAVEIEREHYGFTVELNNGVDLVFDREQNFIGIDLDEGDDDEERIAVELLPLTSRAFLAATFTDVSIVTAIREREDNQYEYKVYLTNGIKIEFAANGNWVEMESKRNIGIPLLTLPLNTAAYIQLNYANYLLSEVEIEKNGSYAVELEKKTGAGDDNIELVFDKDGNFVRVD